MKIIYDDLYEFAEVVIRCNDTVCAGKCEWCPFYNRCQTDTPEMRHVLCAEIEGYVRMAEEGTEFDKKVENVVQVLMGTKEDGAEC